MAFRCGRLLVASVVAASLLSSCAADDGYFTAGDPLRVGVKASQPGLATNISGSDYEGFEISLARSLQQYLSKEAGINVSTPSFTSVNTTDREGVLEHKSADVLIATYSITEDRQRDYDLIGPYLQTGIGILVDANDNSVHSFPDLGGKTVCTVGNKEEENTALRVIDRITPPVLTKSLDDFKFCVDSLKVHTVDAVVADEIILQGFARNDPEIKIATDVTGKLPATDGNTNNYGIAIRKGNKAACELIRDWLDEIYSNGTWETLFNQTLNAGGTGGLDVTRYMPNVGDVDDVSCTH